MQEFLYCRARFDEGCVNKVANVTKRGFRDTGKSSRRRGAPHVRGRVREARKSGRRLPGQAETGVRPRLSLYERPVAAFDVEQSKRSEVRGQASESECSRRRNSVAAPP